MSSEPRTIVVLPFSLRVESSAVTAFELLSRRQREWLYDLSRTAEESVTWLNDESVEAPHDLWVLHQWSEPSRTMDILAMGQFPSSQLASRSPSPDEDRWDNEGGRNPTR